MPSSLGSIVTLWRLPRLNVVVMSACVCTCLRTARASVVWASVGRQCWWRRHCLLSATERRTKRAFTRPSLDNNDRPQSLSHAVYCPCISRSNARLFLTAQPGRPQSAPCSRSRRSQLRNHVRLLTSHCLTSRHHRLTSRHITPVLLLDGGGSVRRRRLVSSVHPRVVPAKDSRS